MNDAKTNSRTDTARADALPIDRSLATGQVEAMPYLESAIPIGATGAAAVAIIVFALDTMAGQPLGTPNALGATIFRGMPFDLSSPVLAINVFSYTLLHTALFIVAATAAITAEFTLSSRGVSPGSQFASGAAALFVALQASILTLMLLLDVPIAEEFGFGRLLAINAIAATAMAVDVYRRATRRIADETR